MTFTELEIVLLASNVILTVLYFMLRKEFHIDRHMTAHLIHAIADGEVLVTRKRDGGINIQPITKEAV